MVWFGFEHNNASCCYIMRNIKRKGLYPAEQATEKLIITSMSKQEKRIVSNSSRELLYLDLWGSTSSMNPRHWFTL